MVTWEMLKPIFPRLVSVTVWVPLVFTGWLPKVTLAGEKLTSVPAPVRDTVCGLPGALSVIVNVPFNVPRPDGLNLTSKWQLAPAARLDPQVPLSRKFGLAAMLAMSSGATPVLLKVTPCDVLVVLISCVPKLRVVGESETTGPTA